MKPIDPIIYNGRGALTTSFLGPFLNLPHLLEGNWKKRASLFIMPGGRDLPYHADLQGVGNAHIRQFVEEGGAYLGICAGAYYGCKQVEFDQGSSLEVCGGRELCFFSGKAVGPAYGTGTFDYNSAKGARAALLTTEIGNIHVYYDGGCFFEGDLTDCKILARYAELPGKPAAIIECKVGKGKAILSGVHLEMSFKDLDPSDVYLQPLISILQQSEDKRKDLWNLCHRT